MKAQTPAPSRILVIDDNPAIHEDFRKILGREPPSRELDTFEAALFANQSPRLAQPGFIIDSAYQGEEGLRAVERSLARGEPYAMTFIDVRMPPGWDGIETIRHIWKVHPELQVVICTAYSDYSWEDLAREIGSSHRLLILKKPFDTVEVLQLAHALTEKWSLTQQLKHQMDELDELVAQRTAELMEANAALKKEFEAKLAAQEELRRSEERFSKAFQASPIALAILAAEPMSYVDLNEAFGQLTGHARQDLIGRSIFEAPVWSEPRTRVLLERLLREGRSIRNLECEICSKEGKARRALLFTESVTIAGQACAIVMTQDLTERLSLEAQLRQAQKMEAIGQLAAGVAHDFNNLLTVIQGHTDLILSAGSCDETTRLNLARVTQATERAAALTRKLLTFSRDKVVKLVALDLKKSVQDVAGLLGRLLGENVSLVVNQPDSLPAIEADPTSIEQVIINLAVNARDAMPHGGKLILTTRTCQIDESYVRQQRNARPGSFVYLEVTDTGTGMSADVLEHIFEPFFTTKAPEKGTGLGLATVYGIVKQHQGWIEVASQRGIGTTFKVFFPVSPKTQAASAPPSLHDTPHGSETVLVVEDEPSVRALVCRLLHCFGYKVLQAGGAQEALQIWSQCKENIDLLLTDLMIPGDITGLELADRCQKSAPALKVLYTSGYSPELFQDTPPLQENANFLPKPFHPSVLARLVRHCLAPAPNGGTQIGEGFQA